MSGLFVVFMAAGGWGHGKTGSGINTLNLNGILRIEIETFPKWKRAKRVGTSLDYFRLRSAFLGLPLVSNMLLCFVGTPSIAVQQPWARLKHMPGLAL